MKFFLNDYNRWFWWRTWPSWVILQRGRSARCRRHRTPWPVCWTRGWATTWKRTSTSRLCPPTPANRRKVPSRCDQCTFTPFSTSSFLDGFSTLDLVWPLTINFFLEISSYISVDVTIDCQCNCRCNCNEIHNHTCLNSAPLSRFSFPIVTANLNELTRLIECHINCSATAPQLEDALINNCNCNRFLGIHFETAVPGKVERQSRNLNTGIIRYKPVSFDSNVSLNFNATSHEPRYWT